MVYHEVFAWHLSCKFLQISTPLIRWMEKLRVCFKLCMFRVHARFGDVPFHPTVLFWCLSSCNLLFQLRHVTSRVNKDCYTYQIGNYKQHLLTHKRCMKTYVMSITSSRNIPLKFRSLILFLRHLKMSIFKNICHKFVSFLLDENAPKKSKSEVGIPK